MEDKIEDIRQACIDAHDVDGNPREGGKSPRRVYELCMENDDIRLADVLLTQNKKLPFHNGYMGKIVDTVVRWNLKDNNLEKQSPETLDFIHKLIV